MFPWKSLVWTGLACCLSLPALNAQTAYGCPPPPVTQDYVKKTTEVEARGRLQSLLTRCGPGARAWSLVADGKTYFLDLATPELVQEAETLDGKSVVLTGTLDNERVSVKTLTAAAE